MASVLLLNASYEPLAVITQRRAVSLIMKGRAEAACDEVTELSGISVDLRVPMVMRLHRYVHVPQRGARWSRRAVLQRDRYTCAYCCIQPGGVQRANILRRQDFTIDHILPVSRGGPNSWGNTVCACWACNQRKGNRTPHEAHMKLHWEPKRPRVNYLVASGAVPAMWKFYLEI